MKRLLHKRITRNGFTLAELLIVVAILAILVAVSIPIFTSKLDSARQATDDANMRAAKALAAEAVLTNDFPNTDWKYVSIGSSGMYSAYYDAENGCLMNSDNGSGIKGYGQGSTSSSKGDILYIGYFIPETGEPELQISWCAPPTP